MTLCAQEKNVATKVAKNGFNLKLIVIYKIAFSSKVAILIKKLSIEQTYPFSDI